jgi:hypothetical protein
VPYEWLRWLAADPTSTGADLSVLGQYGVLGLVAAGLLWFAHGAIQRERDRADRLEADNRRLNEVIQDRVIPALTSATKVAEESTGLLQAMQRERERDHADRADRDDRWRRTRTGER